MASTQDVCWKSCQTQTCSRTAMSLSENSSFPLLPAGVVKSCLPCLHLHRVSADALLLQCEAPGMSAESGSHMPDMYIFCWNSKCAYLALSWAPQSNSGSWVLLDLIPSSSCSTVSLLETSKGIPWSFLPCCDSSLVNNISWGICLVWFFLSL